MKALIFLVGLSLGAAGGYGYVALDRGISQTYSADEAAWLETERSALRRIAADLLIGIPVEKVEAKMAALDLYGFSKTEADRTLIVLGNGTVVVEAENGVVTRIQDDCDRLGDCA